MKDSQKLGFSDMMIGGTIMVLLSVVFVIIIYTIYESGMLLLFTLMATILLISGFMFGSALKFIIEKVWQN